MSRNRRGGVADASNNVSPSNHDLVVLVEDDHGMRRALQRVLEASGFAAETFASAEALLATDAASRALCIVLDIHLPGMSGLALRQHLMAIGKHVPIIFITARDSANLRRKTAAYATGYLVKPFPAEALVAAVNRALGK